MRLDIRNPEDWQLCQKVDHVLYNGFKLHKPIWVDEEQGVALVYDFPMRQLGEFDIAMHYAWGRIKIIWKDEK